MLKNGEIFLASKDEVNDGSECRPFYVLQGGNELWQRLGRLVLVNSIFQTTAYFHLSKEEIGAILGCGYEWGLEIKKAAGKKDLPLGELRPLLKSLFSAFFKDKLDGQLVNNFSRVIDHGCSSIEKIVSEDEHTYIMSFSRNGLNTTMWGHYAAAEKGYALVFSTNNNKFKVKSNGRIFHNKNDDLNSTDNRSFYTVGDYYKETFLELKSVKYLRKPPKVNAFHKLIPFFEYTEQEDHYDVPLNIGASASRKQEDALGLIKSSHWRYESEVRGIFSPYGGVISPEARVLKYDINHLEGIILGTKISSDYEKRLKACCSMLINNRGEERKTLPVLKAVQSASKFEFNLIAEGLVDGDYHGYGTEYEMYFTQYEKLDRDNANAVQELISNIYDASRNKKNPD